MRNRGLSVWIFPAVLAALLAGCGVLGGRGEPVVHYVLRDAAQAPARLAAARPGVLLLRDTEAAGLCQGTRMVFSRAPGRLDTYQYALWNEPPGRRLHQLLKTRLDALGLYAATASLGSGVAGDWQLNTRLLDCRHDTGQPPGVARLSLEAELVRRDGGQLLARRIFTAEAPARQYDAQGAAEAFSQAAGRLLGQVTEWLAQQADAGER